VLFCDVTNLQQCHHPQNIPHLVEEIKSFPLKAKSFRQHINVSTYQKLKGGGGFHQPPPLVPRWGYD